MEKNWQNHCSENTWMSSISILEMAFRTSTNILFNDRDLELPLEQQRFKRGYEPMNGS